MRYALGLVAALVRIILAILVEYRAMVFIWMLAGLMPLLMMVVWRHIAEGEAVGGFDRTDFARYFLVTLAVQQLLTVWVIWNFDEKVRSGTLAIGLLRPFDPYLPEVVENLTANLFRLPMWLPIVAGGLWLTGAADGLEAGRLPIFLLSVAGAWAVKFNLHYALALVSLWTERARAFDGWTYTLMLVLGGGLFPLALLPGEWRAVVELTPFPYLLGFPVEVLTGRLPPGAIAAGLGVQALWTGVLVLVHRLLWWRGLKRFGAVGG